MVSEHDKQSDKEVPILYRGVPIDQYPALEHLAKLPDECPATLPELSPEEIAMAKRAGLELLRKLAEEQATEQSASEIAE